MTEAERAAHKVHKIAYDVALEVPPFRVIGTVHALPGLRAGQAARAGRTEMFVPVTDATATMGGRIRSATRGRRGPGQPLLPARRRAGRRADWRARTRSCPASRMGGTNWTDEPADSGAAARRSGSSGLLAAAERNRNRARRRACSRSRRKRSARASKSVVIFSFGNISMTVRPSLAARTKSSPADRMSAKAGIPTVRSMSWHGNAAVGAVDDHGQAIAAAQRDTDVAQLDRRADRRKVRASPGRGSGQRRRRSPG